MHVLFVGRDSSPSVGGDGGGGGGGGVVGAGLPDEPPQALNKMVNKPVMKIRIVNRPLNSVYILTSSATDLSEFPSVFGDSAVCHLRLNPAPGFSLPDSLA